MTLHERAAAVGLTRPDGARRDHYGRQSWYLEETRVVFPNGPMGWWQALGVDAPCITSEEGALLGVVEHLEQRGVVL